MKYDPEPDWWLWWDTGRTPIHRPDGTRYKHRIDYWAIPLHQVFKDIPGIKSQRREEQLKARKTLWRRLRHGYYRDSDKHIPEPPPIWERQRKRRPDRVPFPRCGARRKNKQPCRAHVVRNKYTGKLSNRCRFHGGHSTGPRTEAGKAASLAALARGRTTRLSAMPNALVVRPHRPASSYEYTKEVANKVADIRGSLRLGPRTTHDNPSTQPDNTT